MVHETANAKEVAVALSRGAFEYQGQKCSAASRAYIPSNLWEDVKKYLVEDLKSFKMGPTEDFGNFINAVIDEKASNSITGYIEKARSNPKNEIIAGGKYDKSKGWFIEPTVVLTTDPSSVGAVTVVANEAGVLHLEANGMADIDKQKPMSVDAMAWIASMTKPITGAAIMILQDEGKLNIADPVSKFIPEFAALKTPSGKLANLTITQVLTHTSGLGEAKGPNADEAHTLADVVPIWLATPMQFEPGTQWKYCQSGINTAARIVEVISGDFRRVFAAAAL